MGECEEEYFPLSMMSRNGSMAQSHIISEPKFGPYDIFFSEFYNPITRTKFSKIFLPPCGLSDVFGSNSVAGDSKKTSKEDAMEKVMIDEDSILNTGPSIENAKEVCSVEKACAVRLASFAIINATASVAAQLTCEKLDDSLDELKLLWNVIGEISMVVSTMIYQTFKTGMVVEKPKVSKGKNKEDKLYCCWGLLYMKQRKLLVCTCLSMRRRCQQCFDVSFLSIGYTVVSNFWVPISFTIEGRRCRCSCTLGLRVRM